MKLDENNQYGYSMTKPLPTGCIKENKNFSWFDFNTLIESVDLMDKIGHLFVFDIFLDTKNSNEKQLVYHEIFPPVIEKQKILEVYERSAYQLLGNIWQNKRETKVVPLHSKIARKFISTNIYSALSRRFEIFN